MNKTQEREAVKSFIDEDAGVITTPSESMSLELIELIYRDAKPILDKRRAEGVKECESWERHRIDGNLKTPRTYS